MKKRMVSAMLCGVMTAGLLAASVPVGAASSAASAESAEMPAVDYSKDSGTINMFISSPEYADAIQQLISEYAKVAPNVTINYETTQNDYPTMLKAKINSGDIPDIFSSTSGKEIDTYMDYSYDLSDQPLMKTIDPAVADTMKSLKTGKGCYGIAIKGNFFGILYNKDIFDQCGIKEFPTTTSAMKDACEKISAKGIQPFTTGFSEWWVFKHCWQPFLDAAADQAGITAAELVQKFESGEAKVKDYPELYNTFFDFIDLAKKYGDKKPLETDLSAEEAAFANGEAAMTLGQGAWIEADCLKINPDLKIGFNGYPVSDHAADCKVIAGSDQALHVYKDSKNLQAVLDFVNYWYTSDYGKSWFTRVAGVVPPIKTTEQSDYEVIKQGNELAEKNGTGALAICYSTDSWHQAFGQIMQSYLTGTYDKDQACSEIEKQWKATDGQGE
ncbi:MAG: extracellular solute-binding protein [Clostridiales bacterium]|nr:extracellular solute-binding protein [Clostridiales bacterium]